MSGKRKVPDFQKIDPHLRTHPRFVSFRDRLGVETPLAHGLLAGLWAFSFDHARDGDLSRFTPAEIASSIGWQGDADVLMSALSVGFLNDGVIHDWHDWGGALFEARDKEARKKYDQYHSEQEKISREKKGEEGSIGEKVPEEKRREKIKNIVSSDDDTFAKFWDSYPPQKRKEKPKALRCWSARLKAGEEAERMVIAARHYASTVVGVEPRYVKLPATFIGPDRPYEDFMAAPNGNGGNGNKGSDGVTQTPRPQEDPGEGMRWKGSINPWSGVVEWEAVPA